MQVKLGHDLHRNTNAKSPAEARFCFFNVGTTTKRGYPYIGGILVQPTAGLQLLFTGVGISIKVSIGIVDFYMGIKNSTR